MTSQEKTCERNLIAAYIDGELDHDATTLLEEHLESCAGCRAELRDHQQLVCQLEAALTKYVNLPVPVDFSRIIAARASSDMRGVRTASENKKALSICMILALAGFALVGATARAAIFVGVARFFTKFASVAGFVLNVVYDAVAGFVVLSRVLGRKVINETGLPLVALVLLPVAIVILSRLISDYHRTGATE